jgi:hypothetical protein
MNVKPLQPKQLLFLLVAFLITTISWSQTTYTWTGPNNGSWATAGNWSPARGVPAANDILRFNDGTTKTITAVPTQTIGRLFITNNTSVTLNAAAANRTVTIGNIAGDDLTIDAGSTLTIGTGNFFTISVTTNATASISGTLIVTAGRIYATNTAGTVTTVNATGSIQNSGSVNSTSIARLFFLSGAGYNHTQDGGTIPTATWNAASTSTITGITGTVPAGLNQSFGNFTWNCAAQSAALDLSNDLTTINGSFTVNNTNYQGLLLANDNGTTYTLTIGNDFIINNNALVAITNGDNITATVNVGDDLMLSGVSAFASYLGYHVATGGSITLAKIIINVAGDFSQTGGLFDFALGDSDAANFGELRLAGNFLQSGTGMMTIFSTDNSISNGTITFNKVGTQTISVAAPANLTRTNFIVASGATLQLLSDLNLTSSAVSTEAGQFTVNNGGTLNAGTNRLGSSTGAVLGVNNVFTLSAGAKIISTNANGLQNLAIGTISTFIASRVYSSGADYEFGGTITGTFTTTPTAFTARNIVVNNTVANVTLSQPMSVTGNLNLVDGELITTAINLLTIQDNATATGYSNISFVRGPLLKRGDDNFEFPTGRAGAGLIPIRISGLSAASDFTANYVRSPGISLGPITAVGLFRISYCEYWTMTRVGAATANVTMNWNPQSSCNAASYVTNLSSIVVARHNGVSWNAFGSNGGTTGTVSSGTVTLNAVNTFNSFALGSSSAGTNPLPVLFANVNAYSKNNGVQVEWSNMTEKDIFHYTVQRSANGRDFTDLSTVAPKSNQSDKAEYTNFDPAPLKGINYYRIQALETSGQVIYTKIVRVETGSSKAAILVYPSPVINKQLTVALTGVNQGEYRVRILNSTGQEIYQTNLIARGSAATESVSLPSQTGPGAYLLLINGLNYAESKLFIVQ